MGKKPTNARYCFKDQQDMCNLLKNLSNDSVKMKRNMSASDLKSVEPVENKQNA